MREREREREKQKRLERERKKTEIELDWKVVTALPPLSKPCAELGNKSYFLKSTYLYGIFVSKY